MKMAVSIEEGSLSKTEPFTKGSGLTIREMDQAPKNGPMARNMMDTGVKTRLTVKAS